MSGTSSRLLTLLSLLQARRDWPGALLAERLAVTPRTVRRDVDRLRELGYPVQAFMGPDGGYRLEAGAELPPLLFDDEQAVALAVALQVATTSGAGIGEAAARALVTLRQVMPARLRRRIDAVQATAVRATGRGSEADPAVLAALTTAVRAREVLRFDHRPVDGAADVAPGGVVPPRRVEPHHLVVRDGRWYLVAWDLDRDDWRTFRVDRVVPRTPTGPRFAPRELPGGDVATFVNARFKGSTGADVWPCTGVVELDLPATEVSPYVDDGMVEALGPDRCRVTRGAWSWVGLAAGLARFDAELRVVGPPALRDACATLADRFARSAR